MSKQEPKTTGRPTDYTLGLSDLICARLAEGNSLRKVCKAEDMPSTTSVYSWFRLYPEFLEQYTRAKEESGDADQDRIDEIAEGVLDGDIEPNVAKVAADLIKWSASKKKPKKYGDRQQIDQVVRHKFGDLTDEDLRQRLIDLDES